MAGGVAMSMKRHTVISGVKKCVCTQPVDSSFLFGENTPTHASLWNHKSPVIDVVLYAFHFLFYVSFHRVTRDHTDKTFFTF